MKKKLIKKLYKVKITRNLYNNCVKVYYKLTRWRLLKFYFFFNNDIIRK